MKDTVQRVSEIASSAHEMTAGAVNVTSAMQSISAVVEENTAATEQMAAQASQVNQSIDSIAWVAGQQSTATEEVSASTEEMSAQIEEMNAQVNELAQMALELQALAGRFVLEEAAGGQEVQQQVSLALQAHEQWKLHLAKAIATGKSDLRPEIARLDNQCGFGKWLYTSVAARGSSQNEQIRALHAGFHRAAGDALALALSGQREQAQAATSGMSAFAATCERLTAALKAWQASEQSATPNIIPFSRRVA